MEHLAEKDEINVLEVAWHIKRERGAKWIFHLKMPVQLLLVFRFHLKLQTSFAKKSRQDIKSWNIACANISKPYISF